MNGDGVVNSTDQNLVEQNLGKTLASNCRWMISRDQSAAVGGQKGLGEPRGSASYIVLVLQYVDPPTAAAASAARSLAAMKSPSLTDKVALITGAGRGIGRGIALAFAREGAALMLTSRSADQLARGG